MQSIQTCDLCGHTEIYNQNIEYWQCKVCTYIQPDSEFEETNNYLKINSITFASKQPENKAALPAHSANMDKHISQYEKIMKQLKSMQVDEEKCKLAYSKLSKRRQPVTIE
eukprot:61144_1